MSAVPTARHAVTFFSLTMESRHGCDWSRLVAPEAVAALAGEVAVGFGGEREPAAAGPGIPAAVQWRFPDGSRVLAGGDGLRPLAHDRAA
jgi:hypothetical protein